MNIDKTTMKETLIKIQQAYTKAYKKPNFIYQYVIDNGIEFEPAILTPSEKSKTRRAIRKIKPKHAMCFYNSMKLWLVDNDFKYCEGYMSIHKDIKYHIYHGWNVLNGKLVDITPAITEFYHYFGVIIPDDAVLKHIQLKKLTPILDDWRYEWEYLREQGYL